MWRTHDVTPRRSNVSPFSDLSMANDILIAARAVHFASTIAVAGAILFRWLVAGPALRGASDGMPSSGVVKLHGWLTKISWYGLAIAVLSAAAWLFLVALDIGDDSLARTLRQGIAWTVLTSTQFGSDWTARAALAGALAACLLATAADNTVRSAWGLRGAALVAAALLGSLAWAGHAGARPGLAGDVHRAADVLHLLAAGAWIGGLGPFVLLLSLAARAGDRRWLAAARAATLRFSNLGIFAVGMLVVTGTLNAYFLLGSVSALLGTEYGRVLMAKIGLFIALVGVAAINRLRLTPRLSRYVTKPEEAHRSALNQLIRNSVLELIMGLVIIAVVGALGTIHPRLYLQPT
jgi:putative copper resistance protein D